jgi:hypothetical protein
MIETMLPIQYLQQAGTRHTEPHRRLILAVLQTVVDDCQGSPSRRRAGHGACADPRAHREARAYAASTDRKWPFSFENLCDAVGVNPGSLRRGLAIGVPYERNS